MKRINEMTREELLQVTEEQRQTLIDLEVAHAGIMPVLEPVYEQVEAVPLEKKDLVYEVHGLYIRNKEDAEKLANIEVCGYSYEDSVGYDFKYLTEPELGKIEIKKFFLKSDIAAAKGLLKRKAAIEARNSAKRKEYQEYESKIKDIVDHVYCKLEEAHEWKAKLDHAVSIFERHLKLAEGNYGIAVNFFKSAYGEDSEIAREVLARKSTANT